MIFAESRAAAQETVISTKEFHDMAEKMSGEFKTQLYYMMKGIELVTELVTDGEAPTT